jgi:hypothetical protein
MMMPNKEVALRKRQQIDSSKRTMFIVVAVVALVSGIALVVSFFLVQQILFHGKVISAKQSTLDTIKSNIAVVDDLKNNVRVLDTNTALNSVRTSEESSALQVILDALPAESNADALGASLQIRFAGEVSGLKVDSLVVTPTDIENSSSNSADLDSNTSSIGFTMSVSGSADMLKEFLTRLERSIRVIEITSVDIRTGSDGLTMNLVGRAYYEPGHNIELGTKVVKP